MTHSATSHNASNCDSLGSKCMKWAAIGTAMAAGAVVLAPYVLPLVGVGEEQTVIDIMTAIHANPTSPGSGLAGLINSGLGAIPLVGETLAKGGIATALTSGAIGVGGVLLGRYIGKHEDGKHFIKWGKVISTAALITSAVVALPTVLTSITAGVAFLASIYDNKAASTALTALRDTIGVANGESLTASSGTLNVASFALPHLLTCGAGSLPALISFGLHKHTPESPKRPMTEKAQYMAPETIEQAASLPPINARFTFDKPTTAFQPVHGILTLTRSSDGTPVTVDEIKTTHTKKIHLLIVDSSLKDFHHVHPDPTDIPGQYSFTFTPQSSNTYKGWSEFAMEKTNADIQIQADMPSLLRRNIAPRIAVTNNAVDPDSGLSFEWKNEGPLHKGKYTNVDILIKDRDGKPVTDLQPVLGSFAHLEGFSADGKTMVHCHPIDQEANSERQTAGPMLQFHIKPKTEGKTQFYLQVQYQGKDVYVPFGQDVLPPLQEQTQAQNATKDDRRSWVADSHAQHTGMRHGLAY